MPKLNFNHLSTHERNKKKYDAKFKAKVALTAIKERKTLNDFPVKYNDKYLYFIERLCLILELTKGKNGLIDFLTSLVPILDANRDSEVAENIINNLYQMDFPDECTLLTDFINEYFEDEDE